MSLHTRAAAHPVPSTTSLGRPVLRGVLSALKGVCSVCASLTRNASGAAGRSDHGRRNTVPSCVAGCTRPRARVLVNSLLVLLNSCESDILVCGVYLAGSAAAKQALTADDPQITCRAYIVTPELLLVYAPGVQPAVPQIHKSTMDYLLDRAYAS